MSVIAIFRQLTFLVDRVSSDLVACVAAVLERISTHSTRQNQRLARDSAVERLQLIAHLRRTRAAGTGSRPSSARAYVKLVVGLSGNRQSEGRSSPTIAPSHLDRLAARVRHAHRPVHARYRSKDVSPFGISRSTHDQFLEWDC
jgi:hypothetical protein